MNDNVARFLQSWEQPKRRVHAGTQTICGDRLFITDPLDMAETPITTPTPVGAFELVVFQRVWTHTPNYPSVLANAYLAMEFSSKPTVRWEQLAAETPAIVDETEFSAEFGWMSILDSDTRRDVMAADGAVDNMFDDWLAKYVMDGERCRDWAHVPLGEGKGFVVCQPGKGNGWYYAFLGRDAAGDPTQIVVDFELDFEAA